MLYLFQKKTTRTVNEVSSMLRSMKQYIEEEMNKPITEFSFTIIATSTLFGVFFLMMGFVLFLDYFQSLFE